MISLSKAQTKVKLLHIQNENSPLRKELVLGVLNNSFLKRVYLGLCVSEKTATILYIPQKVVLAILQKTQITFDDKGEV